MPRTGVLVVADATTAQAILDIVRANGRIGVVVATATEALAQARAIEARVAVIDIQDQAAYAIARALWDDPAVTTLNVAMVPANGPASFQLLMAGFNDQLPAPVDLDQVRAYFTK